MRCEIIALIFACAVCHHLVSTSANSNEREEDIEAIFLKLSSRFDALIDTVDKLKKNSSTGNDSIKQLIQQNLKFESQFKKIEKFEDNFKNIEDRFKKIGKLEYNFQKIEDNSKKIEKLEYNFQKIEQCEDNRKKIEKLEDDLLKLQNRLYACDPNPCNGGRCEVLPDGSGFRCTHCPEYTYGKNCENVKCNSSSKCFLSNDTYYVVFKSNRTWFEAKQQCEDEGMTLAMPKDADTTEFLINKLRSIYSEHPNEGFLYFLIGLKYNEEEKQWQWTDGSELGDYTGGVATFKSKTNGRCGLLHLYGGSSLWSSDACLSSSLLDYPLCEKRISVV